MKKYLFFVFIVLLFACKTTGEIKKTNTFLQLPINYKTTKDIMLIFTGSDWDENSKKGIENILTEEFFNHYSNDFDIYNIDVVRDKTLLSESQLLQNYKFFAEYEITELPAFALETNDADVYAIENFQSCINLSDFEKLVESKTTERETIKSLSKKVKQTSGPEYTQAVNNFLQTVKLPFSSRYNTLVFSALENDPENKSGLKKIFLLWATEIKAVKHMGEKKPRLAADEFIGIAENEVFAPMEKQSCYYNAAYFLASSIENTDEVLSLLNKALKIDPKSELAPQIKSAIYSVSKRKLD